MNPTVTGALIGAGGAAIVAVAGFVANVRNTGKTTAVSQNAVEVSQRAVEVSQQAVDAAKRTVEDAEFKEAMAKVETPIAYLDAPQFKVFLDRDAERLRAAVERIGKVPEN